MELREYLRILKRRRWIIVGTLVLVVVGALATTLRMTPLYTATAKVEVQSSASMSSEAAQLLESMVEPGRRLATQVELIKGEGVLTLAAKSLELPSVDELRDALEIELVPNTQILEISVEHVRPEEARDWANAVATAYLDDRNARAVARSSLATGPLERSIQEIEQKLGEQDAALGRINGEVAAAQSQRETAAAELSRVEAALAAPPAAPAADPAATARIQAIDSRMAELDTAIFDKQRAGDPVGPELAEKDRLRVERADLQERAAPPPAPGPDPALVQRQADLRSQLAGLDAQIRSGQAAVAAPKGERDSLAAQLAALRVQRQSLPDADALRQSGGSVIAAAETPEAPSSPNLLLNMALALVLGSMLGVGFAFLAENLDDRVRTPEEVEERVGAPVLGYVPYVEEWGDAPEPLLATVHEPMSGAAEAYRTLRTNLRFLSLERPLQTVLVTSTMADEGKSTTAANLAVALAEGGTRTILLSGDLRRPTIHRFFDVADQGGIVSVLDGTATVDEALVETGVPNLRILPAGGRPPNPTEIVASSRFGELLESLASMCDLVLVDAPPVLGLADASALASKVDGVLFVVDAQEVARRSLSQAAEQMRKAGGRVLGTIMNAVDPDDGAYGYYYHQYYYGYSDESAAPAGPGERGRKAARAAKAEEPTVIELDDESVSEGRKRS